VIAGMWALTLIAGVLLILMVLDVARDLRGR
jgi:hypothetical protein